MKKIAIFAIAACMGLAANAENSLNILPCKVMPGTTSTYMYMALNNEYSVASISFDLYLPAGVRVWTNSEGKLTDTSISALESRNSYSYYDEEEEEDVKVTSFADLYKNFQTDTNGVEYFSVAGGGQKNCKGNSGNMFQIRLKVADDAVPGVYPVYIKKGNMIDAMAEHDIWFECVSYIVIGDPTDQTLALEGNVPSFVSECLTSGKVNVSAGKNQPTNLADFAGISTLNLSKVAAIDGGFTYKVGQAVVAPTASVEADVKVVAPLPGAGKYGSLNSPIALPDVKCYTYSKVEGNTVVFAETTGVPANETVIIDADVDATVAGATLASVANTTATAGAYYIAPDGSELRKATNTPKIPALRGVWNLGGGGSNLRIALDTPTGIKMIGTADEVFGNTYDLQGRQVQNTQNGVYVVNGKKQFVK